MSTFNFKNGGDFRYGVFGDNNQVTHNLTPEQRSVAVDELLKKLQESIEALAGQLPAAKAEQARNDLAALAKEAKAAEPRKSMFEVTGAGLVDAAKTVAAMAPSITAVVMELGKVLFQ